MEAPAKPINWPMLRRLFPGSDKWPQPAISTEFWDDQAWMLYYEGIAKSRGLKLCPGCGGPAGKGPDGCCEKCYGPTIGQKPKRRHIAPPDLEPTE